MKKYYQTTLLILFLAICSNVYAIGKGKTGLLPTSLKITVIDNLGNVVQGATVTLYGSKEDYRAEKNPLFPSADTNAKGIVKFKKLEPRPYYIHAVKGEMSNNGEGVLTDKLKEGRINKVNTVIQ